MPTVQTAFKIKTIPGNRELELLQVAAMVAKGDLDEEKIWDYGWGRGLNNPTYARIAIRHPELLTSSRSNPHGWTRAHSIAFTCPPEVVAEMLDIGSGNEYYYANVLMLRCDRGPEGIADKSVLELAKQNLKQNGWDTSKYDNIQSNRSAARELLRVIEEED